jgi:ParB/RepB/Spo0J family partition protein
LAHIATDQIQPNPDNPRMTFRQGELEELQESIRRYGIQVPIAVFKRGREYYLIDGERRWRCASKLNLPTIPALIQEEPTALNNLLLMFNIHALREQWDLLTIALKLPTVIELLRDDLGRAPNESELAAKTGLLRSVIRRCRLLMDLPQHHQQQLLGELRKPKAKQIVSEDLYIEIERALKTMFRAMPDMSMSKEVARNALVSKYKSKVIENVVEIRKLAKIARSPKVGIETAVAQSALERVITEPRYPIAAAWSHSIAEAYVEQDVVGRIERLLERLEELDPADIDDDVRGRLRELVERVSAILGTDQ